MGRAPCCEKVGLNKGTWTEEEDLKLIAYVHKYGHHNWRALPKLAGLSRCGKSCRLRWINYLRPDIKRGNFTREEEETVIKLHAQLGNKWSKIASCLPGRTDNEIKNVWNTHLKKRVAAERAMAADASNSHFPSSPSPSSSSSSDQCSGKRGVIEIPVDPSIDMFAMLDDAVRLTGGVEEEEEDLNALSGAFSFSEGVAAIGLDEIELQMPPVAALMEREASKELVDCLELEDEQQLGLLGGVSEVRRSVVPGDFSPWDEMEGDAVSGYFQMFDFDFDFYLSPSPLDAFDFAHALRSP